MAGRTVCIPTGFSANPEDVRILKTLERELRKGRTDVIRAALHAYAEAHGLKHPTPPQRPPEGAQAQQAA